MDSDPLPLQLQLRVEGRRCVVVGAGPVGARRAGLLVEAGAEVVVVAPRVGAAVESLAAAGSVELQRRLFRPGDLDDAVLVVVATDAAGVPEAVMEHAAERRVLVNRADDGPAGDVTFPAVVRRGRLRVAVSTGAAAPAVTRWAADRLDAGLDDLIGLDAEEITTLIELVAEVRAEVLGGPPLDWRSALDGSILGLIRQGRRAEAKDHLLACRSSS